MAYKHPTLITGFTQEQCSKQGKAASEIRVWLALLGNVLS